MCLRRDQLLAQNFDAVLAVIVKLAGDAVFVKFCQDVLKHIVRHPRSTHITGLHRGLGLGEDVFGMGWDGWGWMVMGGDGLGWLDGMGEDGCWGGCWERQLLPGRCIC